MDEPGDVGSRPGIRAVEALLVAAVVGMVLMAVASVRTPLPFLGWYVLSSVVTATAVVLWRPGRWILVVSLAVLVGVAVALTANRFGPDQDPFQRDHDGGVVATRAAAAMVLDGRNPYAADFTADLAPDHHLLNAGRASEQPNPLVEHFPYLPAAFLVQVPVEALASAAGAESDPRWLYAVAVVGVVAAIVRSSRPAWVRAATLLALGANCAVAVYLPWGANDAAAASLVVLGGRGLLRRPLLAGALVALAVALKALLVIAVLPLGYVAYRSGGAAVLRRWGGAVVATLALTTLPYLVASPGDLVEDTVAFNLGSTDLTYPRSGIGLAAMFPDVVTGGVSALLSVVLLVAAGVVGMRLLARWPTVPNALAVTAVLVVAGLLPSRTFQISYLPLPVVLLAPAWLQAEAVVDRLRRSSATRLPDPAVDPAT